MATSVELNKIEVQGLCQKYWSETKNIPTFNKHQEKGLIQVLRYDHKPTSDAPAGFLARHQFLDVEFAVKDDLGKESIEKLRFFVKSAPVDIQSRMNYLEEFGVFKKEIQIYRDVLPQVQNIIPGITPKCYYADNNLLVFEELGAQGFSMAADRSGLLDYEHLKCTVKTLAAMHAGSIILEKRKGKLLNELYTEALTENAYPMNISKDHVRVQNFNRVVEVMKAIVKIMPKYSSKLDYILKELPKQMGIVFKHSQVSTKYKNVFSHGDLWANNIMFQYGNSERGKKPIQCRFVDFQLARYAPPMVDLLTVLTIPTSQSFRSQYLEKLFDDYYGFMSDFLQREGLDIQSYLTKEQFEEGNKEFRIFGLIESCLFSHLTVLPPESTQELTGTNDGFEDFFNNKRVEICIKAFNTDKVYCERLTDMIEDLVDNFVLK